MLLDFSEEDHEEDQKQQQMEKELTSYAQTGENEQGKLGDTLEEGLTESNPVVKKNSFFDQFAKIDTIQIQEEPNKSGFFLQLIGSFYEENLPKARKFGRSAGERLVRNQQFFE